MANRVGRALSGRDWRVNVCVYDMSVDACELRWSHVRRVRDGRGRRRDRRQDGTAIAPGTLAHATAASGLHRSDRGRGVRLRERERLGLGSGRPWSCAGHDSLTAGASFRPESWAGANLHAIHRQRRSARFTPLFSSLGSCLQDRVVGRQSRLALHVGDHVRVDLAERRDAVAELVGDLCQAETAVADQEARERVAKVVRVQPSYGVASPAALTVDHRRTTPCGRAHRGDCGRRGVEHPAAPVAVVGLSPGLPVRTREQQAPSSVRRPVASMYSARSCRSGASRSIERGGRSTFWPATIAPSTFFCSISKSRAADVADLERECILRRGPA